MQQSESLCEPVHVNELSHLDKHQLEILYTGKTRQVKELESEINRILKEEERKVSKLHVLYMYMYIYTCTCTWLNCASCRPYMYINCASCRQFMKYTCTVYSILSIYIVLLHVA